ncbi:MAG: hypothetical protein ABIN67_08065 [Ferruginibacter sp.]
MDNLHSSKPGSITNKLSKQYTFGQKQLLAVILIAIFLIIFVWIWKNIQIQSLKSEHKRSEEALIQKSKNKMEEMNQHFLKLIAKPYVWAVRKDLMQGNLGQLDLYGNDIVKEKNFVSVMVADAKGLVLTSTDKKYEGKYLPSIRQGVNLNSDSAMVSKANDSLLILTSPIMSFNSRIGTLIITYLPRNAEPPAAP